jgi:hypothetical protein
MPLMVSLSNHSGKRDIGIKRIIPASPLTPLQPVPLNRKEKLSWLERGVEERGGEAPSLKLLPPFKQTNNHVQ